MALAVGLGAFGAHGLRSQLDAYSMGIYERAVFYHFIHSLGILIVAVAARTGALPAGRATLVCALLLAGVDLYVSVGREWELLETMRTFAHEAEEMVRNTPSAAELRKLYDREDGDAAEKA